jgi:hypothetical protein
MIEMPFNGGTITGSPTNNANQAQLNDPAINSDRAAAKLITDPTARAAEDGKIDDLIIAQAPAIPWDWDYEANVNSANARAVINEFNGLDDLAFTSIKRGA